MRASRPTLLVRAFEEEGLVEEGVEVSGEEDNNHLFYVKVHRFILWTSGTTYFLVALNLDSLLGEFLVDAPPYFVSYNKLILNE